MTAGGPRSVVKILEYIKDGEIEFEVWIMDSRKREKLKFGSKTLAKIFKAGEEQGLLGDRNLGEGKFDLINIEKI